MTKIPAEPVAPPSTRIHRALSEPSRLRILEVLQNADGPLDVAELASRVDLHVNTVRLHLRVLAEAGLVGARREQRARPGRPRVLYEAAADSPDTDAVPNYRLLAEILASHLAGSAPDPSAHAEQAGRAWGAHLVRRPPFTSISKEDTVDQLVSLHEQLGFRPELKRAKNGKEIVLRRCPFEHVATTYQAVVCPLHLGLVRGALAELGSGVEADWLKPFARKGACVASLSGTSTVLTGSAHR